MANPRKLSVFLNDHFIGVLEQLFDGRTFLSFDEHYRSSADRPILSLSYKTVLNEIQMNEQAPVMGLPAFFSNLLPEGRLRKYLAQRAGVKETQEFRLLAALCSDLPGAVLLKPEGQISEDFPTTDQSSDQSDRPLRFSLAGVQMKFSGNLNEGKITIPAHGIGGHWIVKLPSPAYPHIVELEYSMLLLAQRIGIAVPDFRLVQTSTIQNLPTDIPEALAGDALISKRFDRTDSGGRIHAEDFAQVFAVFDKYDLKLNYQSIAKVIWQESGLDALQEYIRRLVHMVLTGNADMHLKNWALIYPDGVHAKLAPAYDFVSTIVYAGIDKVLPHKIAAVSEFEKVTLDAFRQVARIADLPERPVVNTVRETVDALKEQWMAIKNDLSISNSFVRLIDEHMASVPLANERATVIPVSEPVPVSMTWPGSFVNWQIELDRQIPSGKIVYKNQAGEKIEMDAPRRMHHLLIQRQTHEILTTRSEFANQLIIGYVGERLYDEWRDENFIRIQSRMVEGGVNKRMLGQPELNLSIGFFPVDWREIQKHFNEKDQFFDVDFVLSDGELWNAEVTIASLGSAVMAPNGTRVADIRLYMRNARKLYVIPPENRVVYGSGRFSITQAKLEEIEKKGKGEKKK